MLLYNIILHLTALLLSPLLLIFLLLNSYALRERLGFRTFRAGDEPGAPVWFHAASMGEVAALATVVDALKKISPGIRVVVSTTSVTGRKRAEVLIPTAEEIFLAPLDIPWSVRRLLKHLRPAALVLTETELWPNTIRLAKASGCSLALVNGRMSEKSMKRYRLIRGVLTRCLRQFDLFCVQTEIDGERYTSFGADPGRIFVLGNIKLDLRRPGPDGGHSGPDRESLGIPPDAHVIVAGSTRPGEEAILISGYRRIAEKVPGAVLLIAPRHLDRLPEIEAYLTDQGITFLRRTGLDGSRTISSGILLLDTMGELSNIYALADIAFVGGSLVPVGGHNPLEPALWSVPVLFGPHMDNQRQVADWLVAEEGGLVIHDAIDFTETVLRLLAEPEERKRRGRAALRVVESKTGGAARTVRLLKEKGVLPSTEISDRREY